MRFEYVDAESVRKAVSMAEAIDAVRASFVGLAHGEFELPARWALSDGGFLVMSAHHGPTRSAMVKTLSLNFNRQPAISGTVVWSELARTSSLVADAGAVTALRTGAVTGVATDLMAPKDASRLTIVGAGAQARDQVLAVNTVRPLTSVCVVGRDLGRAAALASVLKDELPDADIVCSRHADEAVAEADIVCTATNATSPVLSFAAPPPRVHVNAIGAYRPTMRELPDELLANADVVVDELDAVLEESGEIIHALSSGALREGDLRMLGQALIEAPSFGPRTVFKSVGVAIQDWAIARLLAEHFLNEA